MTDRCEAWSFSIAGSLPGLNEYTAACRTNPHAGAKLKRGAQMVVAAYARCKKPPVFDGPVFITFAWHEPNRRRDADNVAFAKKFILDALVGLGVLPDDDAANSSPASPTSSTSTVENPRVVVSIERTRYMLDEQAMVDVAAFYNAGASRPANPPTRRDVAEQFHLRSPSTAQNYLDMLEARGTCSALPQRPRVVGLARGGNA